MKTILLSLMGLSLAFLVSCTSNEGAVKKRALEEAEKHFSESLNKEADEGITQSKWLRDSYVEFMKKYSEFEVEDVKFQGETQAVATVVVVTYPKAARITLLKIAGRLAESEVRRFNFANALQLIGQQTGTSSSPTKQPLAVFGFHKDSSGEWRLQNP